jgi:myo-inositol 2-dehydrogenase / D-chiro-inositol 1-dehydrogenase
MPETIPIAFIGTGRMAHLHADHLQLEPDVRIVAACDEVGERTEAFCVRWGGTPYRDHQQMLAHESPAAIYICTPTPSHARLGLDCLEAGAALFVEKPLDLDLAAARQFVEYAEARGTLALTAFQWRYAEAYSRAEELIDGEPVALVNMRWYWTRPPLRWMWDRSLAGGQLVDQSIHLLDASRGLVGEVETVYAAFNRRQVNQEPEFDNWDGYAVTLHYAGGAVGVSASTYGLFPEIQEPPRIDIALRDRLVRVTDKGLHLFTPQGIREWPNPEPLHRPLNRAFIAAVRSGDATHIRTPLRMGMLSTAVALAGNHSAASGQPVNVAHFLAEGTQTATHLMRGPVAGEQNGDVQ